MTTKAKTDWQALRDLVVRCDIASNWFSILTMQPKNLRAAMSRYERELRGSPRPDSLPAHCYGPPIDIEDEETARLVAGYWLGQFAGCWQDTDRVHENLTRAKIGVTDPRFRPHLLALGRLLPGRILPGDPLPPDEDWQEISRHVDAIRDALHDEIDLPDPIGNADLARRARCRETYKMSKQIEQALRDAGKPVAKGSQGKNRNWSHALLRIAMPKLPNGKLKKFLSEAGF